MTRCGTKAVFLKPWQESSSKGGLIHKTSAMNPEVGRLLLTLGESQVQLEPKRRRWAAHHPPGFMEEVTFLFNGHRDLASHFKALEKALDEAKQFLIQCLLYRTPDHPMTWEEGQILVATVASIEGSLTSRLGTPLTTSAIAGALDKLDTSQWKSIEIDVRQFIEQQHHVFIQLKSILDTFRPEIDSSHRGSRPTPSSAWSARTGSRASSNRWTACITSMAGSTSWSLTASRIWSMA